MSNFASFFLI